MVSDSLRTSYLWRYRAFSLEKRWGWLNLASLSDWSEGSHDFRRVSDWLLAGLEASISGLGLSVYLSSLLRGVISAQINISRYIALSWLQLETGSFCPVSYSKRGRRVLKDNLVKVLVI